MAPRRNCKKTKGGAGAAEHAINVYGGPGQQHAISAENNVIAMRGGAGAAEHAINVYGGPGQQHAISAENNVIAMRGGADEDELKKVEGGNLVQQIAVPAVLLIANQTYKPRRSYGKKSRKYRKSRKSRSYKKK